MEKTLDMWMKLLASRVHFSTVLLADKVYEQAKNHNVK